MCSTAFPLLNHLKMAPLPPTNAFWSFILLPPSSPARAPPLKGTALRCSKRRVLLLALCECGNTTGCGRFFWKIGEPEGEETSYRDGNCWPLEAISGPMGLPRSSDPVLAPESRSYELR